MIRAALILPFLALPAHANDIFVCHDDRDWELTVAFPPDGGCILDNVEGEARREGDVVICTTEEPPQVFRLDAGFEFTFRGDDVSYEAADDEAVYEGHCTRS